MQRYIWYWVVTVSLSQCNADDRCGSEEWHGTVATRIRTTCSSRRRLSSIIRVLLLLVSHEFQPRKSRLQTRKKVLNRNFTSFDAPRTDCQPGGGSKHLYDTSVVPGTSSFVETDPVPPPPDASSNRCSEDHIHTALGLIRLSRETDETVGTAFYKVHADGIGYIDAYGIKSKAREEASWKEESCPLEPTQRPA